MSPNQEQTETIPEPKKQNVKTIPTKITRINDAIIKIKEEVHQLIDVSKEFKRTTDEAKTKPKRNIYKKKLKKNNQRIMGAMVTLQQYETLKSKEMESAQKK